MDSRWLGVPWKHVEFLRFETYLLSKILLLQLQVILPNRISPLMGGVSHTRGINRHQLVLSKPFI